METETRDLSRNCDTSISEFFVSHCFRLTMNHEVWGARCRILRGGALSRIFYWWLTLPQNAVHRKLIKFSRPDTRDWGRASDDARMKDRKIPRNNPSLLRLLRVRLKLIHDNWLGEILSYILTPALCIKFWASTMCHQNNRDGEQETGILIEPFVTGLDTDYSNN